MKKIVVAFYLFITFFSASFAQQNFVLYNMHFVPQSIYANPAFIPASRINIGLPVISSLYTSFGNSGFIVDDIFKTSGSAVSYNIDGLISKLNTNNYITGSVHIDLLSFGIKLKNNYFSFNLTEKADFWFRYPKDFLDFIWKGNGAFLGTEKNFNFGISATHYREWGFGWTREMNEKLTLGGRLKILSGMENISTKKSDVKFYTDPNDFSYRASTDILINSSYDKDGFSHFSAGSYMFNFKNLGLGVDLGANYKMSEKFSFSASLIDLGYINWKSNTTNYQSKNPGAQFVFKGVAMNVLGSDTLKLDKALQKMSDSLTKTFAISDDHHNKYKTYLPAQMYVGANYAINKINTAGILLYGQMLDNSFRPGLTLSLSSQVGKALSSVLTYSMFNRSYNNVGFGLSVNLGPVQLYAISDNVLGMILLNNYKNTDGSDFSIPAYTKNFNLRAGLNLTFGRKTHDKDKDGVKDKEDNCPDVAGLKEFKGCPDKDGDKIIDKDDMCPDVAGLAQFNGCPDTDGDGIKDIDDGCPNDKGPVYTKGCPDADNDSIRDADDACPHEKGLQLFMGCPDKDNDSIPDKNDKCPDKAGSADNNGCPQVKLILKDVNGNVVAIIIRNKNGEFVYEKLLADENVLFKIEGEDSDLKEINLILAGQKRKLVKDKDGNFRFETLSSDVNKLTKENEKDDALKLSEKTATEKTANTPPAKVEPKAEEKAPVVVQPKSTEKPATATKTIAEQRSTVPLKKEEKRILNAAFTNLDFKNGKEIIQPSSFAALGDLAKLLKKNPDWILRVSGHTDNVGNKTANMELSRKRAEMVKKFMVLSGISHERIVTEYHGPNKPITSNKTEEGRKKNRRVEMWLDR